METLREILDRSWGLRLLKLRFVGEKFTVVIYFSLEIYVAVVA